MTQSTPQTAYRVVLIVLTAIIVGILGLVGTVLIANRPPSADAVAATLTALPSPTPTVTPTPTAVPTLASSNSELLVCQRQAGEAMNARSMVGAVNISDDHRFLLTWISSEWEVNDLDDALGGVIMGFEVALDVWRQGCAVYDRVEIKVHDQRGEQQTHQLTVTAQMDDLLKWQGNEFTDSELLARLQVVEPTSIP